MSKNAFPSIGWWSQKLCGCAGLLLVANGCAVAQTQDMACGDPFHNHFGPYDYRTATKAQRDIVESYHFTHAVETLQHGQSTTNIGADIAYTLRVFPNNPRALSAMAELARREKPQSRRAPNIPLIAGSTGLSGFDPMTAPSD